MTRKATTVRLPEDLANTAEVAARARGTSVNQVILAGEWLEVAAGFATACWVG